MNPVESNIKTDLIHELSADLVGYWKTQTIYAAVNLGLIDALPSSLPAIAVKTNLKEQMTARLLRALWELNIAKLNDDNIWELTPKGEILKPTKTSPMAAASMIWANSHYHQWQFLADSIVGNEYNRTQYFTEMAKDQNLLSIYQTALTGYALHDYKKLLNSSCWAQHSKVVDVGGGTGAFLHQLCEKNAHLKGCLIDLPQVIDQISDEKRLMGRCNYKGQDFFEPWGVNADAIVFSRVLHDWPDHLAVRLLLRAKEALLTSGKLYIQEMILEDDSPKGGLLDLNMLVMTGGRERSLVDWRFMLEQAGLKLSEVEYVSPVISILTVKPVLC
ncbi:MAG: methyltransferase [Myxococcaceae bacterium]